MLDQLGRIKQFGSHQIAGALETLALAAARAIGRRAVFVATWREGKNFGDDYLGSALCGYLKNKLPNARIISTNLMAKGHRLSKDDVLIIGGGGLWGPCGRGALSTTLYESWMNTEAKLIIANIGVESYDPASSGQLIELSNKALLFSVRDYKSWSITRQVLGENQVLWAADNTYLNPLRIKRRPRKHCIGVNICGPEQENHSRLYPVEAIVSGVSKLSDLGYSLKGAVFTYQNALSDYKYCRQIDSNCRDSFSVAPYRDCEIFIGMHFHSVVLALQNKIPVIAISYSDKVQRLMTEYGLQQYCLAPEDSELPEKLALLIKTLDKKEVLQKIHEGNERVRQRLKIFESQLLEVMTS